MVSKKNSGQSILFLGQSIFSFCQSKTFIWLSMLFLFDVILLDDMLLKFLVTHTLKTKSFIVRYTKSKKRFCFKNHSKQTLTKL